MATQMTTQARQGQRTADGVRRDTPRRITRQEATQILSIPSNLLPKWAATMGLNNPGQGHFQHLTPVQVLALAAGMEWREAGANPLRVQELVAFIARQPLEHIEAEL